MKDKKLNVLQINKLYYPTTGGIERVVQQIAEGLNERTNMKVLVCREKGKSIDEEVNHVEVHRAGSLGVLFSLPISFSFFLKLRKLSKDQDILQFHMPFPLGDLAGLLSGYKGKVVIWWHSDIVRQKKLMKLYKPLMEYFLKRADLIIVATQGHIDGSSYLQPYKDKCRIIPFGVDTAIAESAEKWMNSIKKGPSNGRVRFLFVGRLVYYKGCKVMIEAFRKVKNAELIIIGNGDMEGELKQKVLEYHIENRVQFLGNVGDKELTQEFEKCDVFVLPSIVKSEAFGLVQMEAMAYGKPVINTNLPSGVPYVSIDKVTGLTVEPDNVEELEEAMNWMIKNETERIQMGKRARERVLNEYQMDKMMDRVMKAYEEVVKNR